jgi:hypothetical protein
MKHSYALTSLLCVQTLAALKAAQEQVALQTAEAESARKAARDEHDKLDQVPRLPHCLFSPWLHAAMISALTSASYVVQQ